MEEKLCKLCIIWR